MKIGILGAGLTGLELGRCLIQRGIDFVIFEKESQIGGLARTIKSGDYYWDFGVHAMYSKDKDIVDHYLSLPIKYQHSQRDVRIYHTGKNNKHYLVDYPFEEGVRDLPINHRMECINGYIKSRLKGRKEFAHLKDWIENCLGYGIAKHFMTPYNNKIWNCGLEYISMDLVSAKITPASVKDFLLAALGKKVVGRRYQAKFIYPLDGVQAFVDETAKNFLDRIRCDSAVVKLEKTEQKWRIICANGQREDVDRIVSTMPLVELLKIIENPTMERAYDVLKWNDTHFVMIGLKEGCAFNVMRQCHWAFFKEDEIFYRITMMQNFSEKFLPTLVAEITNKGNCTSLHEGDIKARVIGDLLRCGIIANEEDIAAVEWRFIPHTYPIPTVGVQKVKDVITDALQQDHLHLLGRNGHWDYINMDGVLQKVKVFVQTQIKERRMLQ